MARFAAGEVDVLVATSVIEVGIDVPNASVMVIEEADRYGISQLHQLRGRVGPRRSTSRYCLLFPAPTSCRGAARGGRAERDGFRLAEIDLTLRGEGDVFGTRQHGLPEFRVARLPEDAELLERARACARRAAGRGPGARRAEPRSCGWTRARPALRRARGRADRGLRRCGSSPAHRRAGACPAPRAPGRGRPPDRVREALFSILGPVDGLRVLDLYAGSGALGIEALSRGRGGGHVRRLRRRGGAVVRDNLERWAGRDEASCCGAGRPRLRGAAQRGDAGTWSSSTRHIDSRPASGLPLGPLWPPVLDAGARIVCESSVDTRCAWTCPLIGERRYGDTLIADPRQLR